MPGTFGIVQRTPASAVNARMAPLSGRREGSTAFRHESLVDGGGQWGLGRTHLGVLNAEPQLREGEQLQVLFHGDLHNADELRAALDPGLAPIGNGVGALVAAAYRQHGEALAERLHGAFCAVVLDARARRITLIADRLGSYPLYWFANADGLAFSSELRSLLRVPGAPRALNGHAVADYLSFGFPFGTKTLADGVELVPSGTTLTYDWDTGEVSIARYAEMVDAVGDWSGTKDAYFDELTERFRAAVDRGFAGAHAFGLSLSGGMDSRAILSTVNGRASSITTYTLGVDGCADQVIAERLSTLSGTHHLFFELDDRYLRDFLPNLARMVSATDGMYLSHGLTEILALDFIGTTGVEVLLRGHGGELAKAGLAWPFHTDARVYEMSGAAEIVPYLLERVNYISRGVDLAALFTPEWARHVGDAPRASLEASIGRVALSPADLCSYLYLSEHHRRFTVASLELFRQRVEVRMPFVDEGFLRTLFRAPSRWRDGLDIHRMLTRRHQPALLRVRNSNTGAPGDAGPLTEAALDKLNTILKRLNVRGYRHYHHFDAWMKARLVESVEAVLLAPRTIERGIFRAETLRRLLDETRSGAADHGYLLQTLLIIELWQQENL